MSRHTAIHSSLPQLFVTALCQSAIHSPIATALCHSFLPQCYPQLFATAHCHSVIAMTHRHSSLTQCYLHYSLPQLFATQPSTAHCHSSIATTHCHSCYFSTSIIGRYVREERLEIQVWLTTKRYGDRTSFPHKRDKLLGSTSIALFPLLDGDENFSQIR